MTMTGSCEAWGAAGSRVNRGRMWGVQTLSKRGAQLEPRGKARDLGGGWSLGPGPRC